MEHMTPEGLRQGYFCAVCGESCNLYATGHGIGRCQPNPDRVRVLQELNSNGAGTSLPNREPTPTPSITVGTQVRLTGVVVQVDRDGYVDIHLDGDGGDATSITPEAAKYAEVIRQPFKRGEVVHLRGSTVLEPVMVLEDESDGRIIYISLYNVEGQSPYKALASDFERRP